MAAAGVRGGLIRLESHWNPGVDFARLPKVRRGHADDGVGFAVELNRAPNDIWFAAKYALPKRVAQNDDVVLSGRVFLRHKSASEDRLNLIDVEVMPRRFYTNEPLWFAFACQVNLGPRVSREVLPGLCLFGPIEIVRW